METLDLRSLKCPLPALMTRRALARLGEGTGLTVVADDPLAAVDIPHMCHAEGHTVESVTRCEGHTEFRLRAGIRPDCVAAAARLPGPDGK